MDDRVEIGMNRTGIATSPKLTDEMLEGTGEFLPSSHGDERAIGIVRGEYAKSADGLGSVPPPTTLTDAAATALRGIRGMQPTQLLDKLGSRLAFERSGVRLYEALISKLDALGSYEGGPGREELVEIMQEEFEHFRMLADAIAKLGGDPTVVTPCADLHATLSRGVLEVAVDPRTSLSQSLEAALLAELADGEAWDGLIELVRATGEQTLVRRFEQAEEEEAEHLERVRGWLAAAENREQ